jgi:hypothetical protein
VVGIDDRVADLEVDALDLADDLEVLQELLFTDVGDGVPPSGSCFGTAVQVCR